MSSSDSFTVIVLVGLALACFLLWLAFRILKWTTKKVIVPAAKITGEVVGTTAQITTDIAVSAATAVAREHDKSHGTDYATSIEEKREGIVQFAEKAGKAVGGAQWSQVLRWSREASLESWGRKLVRKPLLNRTCQLITQEALLQTGEKAHLA